VNKHRDSIRQHFHIIAHLLFVPFVCFVVPLPAFSQAEPPAKIRLLLIGDSTVASYPNPPADKPDMTGWGQVFGELFTDKVEVINHAKSGRSSKSFIREGLWEKALAVKADYVFIQFGHNDQKGKPAATEAEGEFRDNLKRYIAEARERGTKPILVTPVARRIFAEGRATSTLGPYADAMKIVGEATQTPVVELHASSVALYDKLGDEASSDFTAAATDRTHFSRKGALAMAKLVADALREQMPELKSVMVSSDAAK
jgi:lysophospholipase L1-like esterase